jgi:hypothetical protein
MGRLDVGSCNKKGALVAPLFVDCTAIHAGWMSLLSDPEVDDIGD